MRGRVGPGRGSSANGPNSSAEIAYLLFAFSFFGKQGELGGVVSGVTVEVITRVFDVQGREPPLIELFDHLVPCLGQSIGLTLYFAVSLFVAAIHEVLQGIRVGPTDFNIAAFAENPEH